MVPLILAARGSRDPRFVQAVWDLARAVAARRPGQRVRAAFLRHEVPDLRAALAKEAALAHSVVTVVPLLLCDGYHARLLPSGGLGTVNGLAVRLAPPLGPTDGTDRAALDLLVAALRRRLAEAAPGPDALVLGGAASRATRAMQTIAVVARALGAATGLPCQPASVSGSESTVAGAAAALRARGARGIAAVSFQLGPGRLFDRLVWEASRCGIATVTAPLGAASELVELILTRASEAERA
jgi:sirohydrochlorin ferrochelatase